MNLGLGKQVGGKLSSWSHCCYGKSVEKKTFAIFDGSYAVEPSSIRMGGREKITSKINILRVDHHLCGCIADENESRMLLLYSNNAAS